MKELEEMKLNDGAESEEECKGVDEYERVFVAVDGVVAKVTTLLVKFNG